jgi:hypothetical protein
VIELRSCEGGNENRVYQMAKRESTQGSRRSDEDSAGTEQVGAEVVNNRPAIIGGVPDQCERGFTA